MKNAITLKFKCYKNNRKGKGMFLWLVSAGRRRGDALTQLCLGLGKSFPGFRTGSSTAAGQGGQNIGEGSSRSWSVGDTCREPQRVGFQ